MSPYLKEHIPLGSLAVEISQLPAPTAGQKHDDGLLALGWKMRSLGTTADSLLGSAIKLEAEIEKETIYWEEVLEVKRKGWPICRLPNERSTLGVRYGFGEGVLSRNVSSQPVLTPS